MNLAVMIRVRETAWVRRKRKVPAFPSPAIWSPATMVRTIGICTQRAPMKKKPKNQPFRTFPPMTKSFCSRESRWRSKECFPPIFRPATTRGTIMPKAMNPI